LTQYIVYSIFAYSSELWGVRYVAPMGKCTN